MSNAVRFVDFSNLYKFIVSWDFIGVTLYKGIKFFYELQRSGGIKVILDISWLTTFIKVENGQTIYSTTDLSTNELFMAFLVFVCLKT